VAAKGADVMANNTSDVANSRIPRPETSSSAAMPMILQVWSRSSSMPYRPSPVAGRSQKPMSAPEMSSAFSDQRKMGIILLSS